MVKNKTLPVILLVDDEPDFLSNLSLALEAAGYQTLTASNGYEALILLRSHSVDLILSDLCMPDLGGYQFYEELRKNPRWTNIPFLFLTGSKFISTPEIHYGKAMGVDDYLLKPIQVETLLQTVHSYL